MQVTFLGVGEACDERLPNTAVWIESGAGASRRSVLLDCGFTVPPEYWRHGSNPDDLDAVWISHFHGDHFFGLPALLLRFWEQKRKKPLFIVGQSGIEEKVRHAMELAYPNFLPKLAYPLFFATASAAETTEVVGLQWTAVASGHGQTNLAVRLHDGDRTVFYSGDGMANDDTVQLAAACDLIVHEAFRLDDATPGHGTVVQCITMARSARAHRLALVHMQRDERRERIAEVLGLISSIKDIEVFLPEPGDSIVL